MCALVEQHATGMLHLDWFESYMSTYKKKNRNPTVAVFFLVDDIGLEPMTFRTSSGCSSQLS